MPELPGALLLLNKLPPPTSFPLQVTSGGVPDASPSTLTSMFSVLTIGFWCSSKGGGFSSPEPNIDARSDGGATSGSDHFALTHFEEAGVDSREAGVEDSSFLSEATSPVLGTLFTS